MIMDKEKVSRVVLYLAMPPCRSSNLASTQLHAKHNQTHVIATTLNDSGNEDISVCDALSNEVCLVGEELVENS
jgi:hypothetical protein